VSDPFVVIMNNKISLNQYRQFVFCAEIFNPLKKKSAKIKCLLFRLKPQKLPVMRYTIYT